MRPLLALLLLGLASALAGCLWNDPPQTPPKECVVTTDPKACHQSYRR